MRAIVTWAAIDDVDRLSEEAKQRMRREGHIFIHNGRTGQDHRLDIEALEDVEAHRDELDIQAACGRIEIPALLIHGSEDLAVEPEAASRLHAALASKNKRLLLIEGQGHTFGATHPFLSSNPTLDSVISETVRFLRDHLLA